MIWVFIINYYFMSNIKLLTPEEIEQAHKKVPQIVLGELGINTKINCIIYQLSSPEKDIASVLSKFIDITDDKESGIANIFHEWKSYVVSQHDVISLPSQHWWKKRISALLDLEKATIYHIDGAIDNVVDIKNKKGINEKQAIVVFTDKSGNIRTYARLDRRENLSLPGKILDIIDGKIGYMSDLTDEMKELLLQWEIVTSVS